MMPRQFDVLRHALCHGSTPSAIFNPSSPLNELHVAALHSTREALWRLYHQLKAYKLKPNPKTKRAIKTRFDTLCKTKTDFQTLNQALKRRHKNKAELLLVLERPDIPLHNNLSERDIREYVIKRKISGSTRSEDGRRARDTFASLKKTWRGQGIRVLSDVKRQSTGFGGSHRLGLSVCRKSHCPDKLVGKPRAFLGCGAHGKHCREGPFPRNPIEKSTPSALGCHGARGRLSAV